MQLFSRSTILVLCIAGLIAAPAPASDMNWTFQRIDSISPSSNPQVSLSMRTGETWPTAIYSPIPSGPLTGATLTPVGWAKSTLDSLTLPGYVSSAAGTDGRVGTAWQSTSLGTRIRFGQLTSLGWQYSTVANLPASPAANGANAPDVAYLSGNRAVVAYAEPGSLKIRVAINDGLNWDNQAVSFTGPGPSTGTFVSTAVNSQGDIAVAYSNGSNLIYAQKSIPGGAWSYVDLGTGFSNVKNLSLAFGPNDEVGLAATYNTGGVTYSRYDIQSGTWQTDTLATGGVTSPRVNLVFDKLGHPMLTYVADQGGAAVHYRTNDGGGWLDVTLPVGIDPVSGLTLDPLNTSDAALALDHAGIPVISYYTSGGLVLAYDPIAPEPASLLLLIGGLGIIARRRQRRA